MTTYTANGSFEVTTTAQGRPHRGQQIVALFWDVVQGSCTR